MLNLAWLAGGRRLKRAARLQCTSNKRRAVGMEGMKEWRRRVALTGDWWSARRSLIDCWRGLEGKRERRREILREGGGGTPQTMPLYSRLLRFDCRHMHCIVQIIQPHDSTISIYHHQHPKIS